MEKPERIAGLIIDNAVDPENDPKRCSYGVGNIELWGYHKFSIDTRIGPLLPKDVWERFQYISDHLSGCSGCSRTVDGLKKDDSLELTEYKKPQFD